MAAPKDLKDLYVEELQDLWSANNQMNGFVDQMASETSDDALGERLKRSADGVQKNTAMLRELLAASGSEGQKQHCNGMEGLVSEARRHALDSGAEGAVRDVAIIAQYQRMCHYGLAGFGTAKAYAEALGRDDDARKLDDALRHIHESDDYYSEVAERAKNLRAA